MCSPVPLIKSFHLVVRPKPRTTHMWLIYDGPNYVNFQICLFIIGFSFGNQPHLYKLVRRLVISPYFFRLWFLCCLWCSAPARNQCIQYHSYDEPSLACAEVRRCHQRSAIPSGRTSGPSRVASTVSHELPSCFNWAAGLRCYELVYGSVVQLDYQ